MKKRECFLKKHFTFTWRIQEDNLKTVESFGNATFFFFLQSPSPYLIWEAEIVGEEKLTVGNTI